MLRHLIALERGGGTLANPVEQFLDGQMDTLHRSGESPSGVGRIPCQGLTDQLGKIPVRGHIPKPAQGRT